MKKVSFASLMLGFGGTLAVLVAVAMPPGGWGVAVGVGLGLLGCIPVFVIAMMVVNRDRSRRYERESYEEVAPQQIPVIIMQQPGLPYGNRYSQPEPGLYNPEAYTYLDVPEGYEYYPQEYAAQPQPRQERPRSTPRRSYLPPGYYPAPNVEGYAGQYYYSQPENYYGQPAEEVDPRSYYANEYPQLDLRRQPQITGYDEELEPVRREQRRTKTRRSNVPNPRNDEPVDAEFRTFGEV